MHRMRRALFGFIGVLLCASPALGQTDPSYEELLKGARRAASKGTEFSLLIPGKDAAAVVYYNKPNPYCFAYSIPGEWRYGKAPGSWQSRDGQDFVGVFPWEAKDFRRYKGETPVEKAAASFARDYEKQIKQPVQGATLTQIEHSSLRIWKWSAPPVKYKGRDAQLGTKYIIEVGADGLLVLTVLSRNQDELAQKILASLKTSTEAPCFLPELEKLLAIVAAGETPTAQAPK